MTDEESRLQNELANCRYECTRLSLKVQEYEKQMQRLDEANLRLADRNWELQNRVFNGTKLTGT